ncbi:EfeM/EfeO family lipoprotein [Actinophytocola sp.]|uniref:EfeM/EfeO family lipoprotein n=1 Tax=Actinophytocola sp. TaxID=1872138 RepID=UPI00389A67D8
MGAGSVVRSRTWWALGAVVVLATGGTLLALDGSPERAGASPDPVITVSRSACGRGWADPKPGRQSFQLRNSGVSTAEVELIDPGTGAIYGEVEGLGPGTTGTLRVRLGNGVYAFRCLVEDTGALVGPSVRVTGAHGGSGPAVVPVTANDLLVPVREYRDHVIGGLATLANLTGTLAAVVRGGDRAGSRAAWSAAHLSYERLGAAYGAFGDSDGAINGTADSLAGGVGDPDFTGFHRLEYGLWHDEPMAALTPVADRLDADVRGLRDSFPDQQIDPNDLGLRAHEIMENTLRFELTAKTDYGSGTNIATALANLDGSRAVLTVLRPLLTSRLPNLAEVDSWVDRTDRALHAAQRPDGSWTPVPLLDHGLRQKINAAVSELTELLAPVATVTAPRRTA